MHPMKKTFTHFAAFLLLLLLGCQAQPASEKASAPSEPAPVTETVSAAPLPQQEAPQLPDVCRLYYDYTKLAYIVPAASDLPLSAEAKRGAPDVLGLWYQGEFTDISQEGFSVSELTEGKATEAGDYGRFCWNGQRYHCIHVQAADSYIPNLTSDCGGILWLELTGSCWGDDGTTEGGYFTGFDTVILTGSGTLELKQNLDCGRGERPFPALILDGPEVTCPSASLVPNTAADTTANLVLLSGRLRTEALIIGGDVCITGGSLSVNMLIDCLRLVCRGGETILTEGWGNAEEWASKVPAVLLTGGTLTADLWLDERTVYYLWAGSITGPGLTHLPSVHLLGENVTVRDTLES
mgnify:FL=1